MYLERMTALTLIELHSMKLAQEKFISAEHAVLACEKNISQISTLIVNECFIQSIGKNLWLISSKQKPGVEIQVFLDEKTGQARRLNWRQTFE